MSLKFLADPMILKSIGGDYSRTGERFKEILCRMRHRLIVVVKINRIFARGFKL